MARKTSVDRESSEDIYLVQFGEAVRLERKSLGYSQESFADHVKMDRSYMGGVERGQRNLSLTNIMRILEGLEMDPGGFFSKHIHLQRRRRKARAATDTDVAK